MTREEMLNRSARLSRRAGFTLVELMLVVVIIGFLATVAVVATKGKTKRAAIAASRATIGAVGVALDGFEVDMGTYPASLQELITGSGNPAWNGPYLKSRLPKDAWGNDIQYSRGEDGYELKSLGPDGVSSGDDLTN